MAPTAPILSLGNALISRASNSSPIEVNPAACTNVGPALPDLAGVGILASFAGQGLISMVIAFWYFFFSESGRLDVKRQSNGATGLEQRKVKRLETFSDILMVGFDLQLVLGIAYMISVLVDNETIGLYHLRLAFDTVSFVGVSAASALVYSTFCHAQLGRKLSYRSFRYLATYLFALMFLAITLNLIVELSHWDVSVAGRCYNTRFTTLPNAAHPAMDILYVSITGASLLVIMGSASYAGPARQRLVLVLAFLEYPLHLYFMAAILHENQPLLDGASEKEDKWDFGQTTATVLLALAAGEVVAKLWEYMKWKQAFDRGEYDSEMELV